MIGLALATLLLAAPPGPLHVDVYVPLCDGSMLDCGSKTSGDPRSLQGNLYWGAMYGAERYLSRAPGFRVLSRTDAPDPARVSLLRQVVVARAAGKGEREVVLSLKAYAGDRIDDALDDFLDASAGTSSADLIVWSGHNRLMDVAEAPATPSQGKSRPVAVLACVSDHFFTPVFEGIGAKPVVMTRSLMAPEAYLLEALAASIAKNGVEDREAARAALVAAYAKYQKISPKAAGTVFSPVPPAAAPSK